jgi:hypothetical protein
MEKLKAKLQRYIDNQHVQLSMIQAKVDDAMTIIDAIESKEPLTPEKEAYFKAIAEASSSSKLKKLVERYLNIEKSRQ